jgi:hypothetical protein
MDLLVPRVGSKQDHPLYHNIRWAFDGKERERERERENKNKKCIKKSTQHVKNSRKKILT